MPDVLYHVCSYTASLGVPQMLCTKPLNSYKGNRKSQINYKVNIKPILMNEIRFCDKIQSYIFTVPLLLRENSLYVF